MRYGIPVARSTRTTWRTDAMEIAQALGIPVKDRQYVVLESAESDAELPLGGEIDVVVWYPHPPTEYHTPEMIAGNEPADKVRTMKAQRRCWWCGYAADVDTELGEGNGLIRDDGTMDGSESWICAPSRAAECVAGREPG